MGLLILLGKAIFWLLGFIPYSIIIWCILGVWYREFGFNYPDSASLGDLTKFGVDLVNMMPILAVIGACFIWKCYCKIAKSIRSHLMDGRTPVNLSGWND